MAPSLPGTVAGLATLAVTAAALTVPSAAAGPDAKATAAPAVATTTQVTLLTGDVVTLTDTGAGPDTVSVDRAPGSTGGYQTYTVGDDLHVVPDAALPFLANGRVDADLFNVTGLVEQGYDDASVPSIPLIVQYGPGVRAAAVDAPAHSTQGARAAEHRRRRGRREQGPGGRLLGRDRPAGPRPLRRWHRQDPPRRQGRGLARRLRRAGRRPRGVGAGPRRHRRHRRRARHRRRPDAPRPRRAGGRDPQLRARGDGHRRQRPRHPRRLDGGRHRRRLRRARRRASRPARTSRSARSSTTQAPARSPGSSRGWSGAPAAPTSSR